jgi:hypothetical protein
MATNITRITGNVDYNLMLPHLLKVRDCVRGSVFIKGKRSTYLPHPSSVAITDPVQIERYNQFLAGAEFDEFTSNTKRVLLGKSKLDDIKFTPPNGLEYLTEDVDKDGLSMKGLIASCYGNVLEVKWHLLVTDYNGLSDLKLDQTEYSAQDIKDANPRPTIRQYPRESVIDWTYERINGAMQLTYILLEETGTDAGEESGLRNTVTSQLKLGLDERGYYQQKRTDSKNGESSFGEKNYLIVAGKNLNFIPVSIACDEEFQTGNLPLDLGFLAPIADLALYRYQVSAKYKSAMSRFIPSMHIMGVDEEVWKTFQIVNRRDFVACGEDVANIWSGSKENPVTVELLEASGSLQQFADYLELNKNTVRAMGGVFKTDSATQRTATEILEEASTSTAILMPIANNIESAINWQIAYCAMFDGLVSAEYLGEYVESIELDLPRDFGVSKLTVEEIKALLEVYSMGLLPRDEFLKIFELGGWSISTAQDLLDKLDSAG